MKRVLFSLGGVFACLSLLAQTGDVVIGGRSSPPDLNNYSRAVLAEDRIAAPTVLAIPVIDLVINNTDPNLKNTDLFNDGEPSIAINPSNPNEIVLVSPAAKGRVWFSFFSSVMLARAAW